MKRMILAFLAFTSVALPASVQAQMLCIARADMVTRLQGKYAEAPVAIGLSNSGGVIEVLVSPDGGTWTIIVTDPQGVSCLMAAGEYWESAKTALMGRKI